MPSHEKLAISLFSCGGIGDLAFRSSGIKTLLSNELLEERHQVFKSNYPDVECITGDIRLEKQRILETSKRLLGKRALHFLYATPPCQGMSKNGRGKLLNSVRSGSKPEIDERNFLILPTMEIAKELQPEIVLLENVPEMLGTELPFAGGVQNTIDYIASSLGSSYTGRAEVVEFANYGVPQRRQRLITIFTRVPALSDHLKKYGSFLPPETHAQNADGKRPWVTVRDLLANLPPLDAKTKETAAHPAIPLHKVPLLGEEKYFWVSNTPPEKSAFDNQCVECGSSKNAKHGSMIGKDGINRSKKDTPLYCNECGSLLPRPWVKDGEAYRLMKGFTSAYKRMRWDHPSPTLTRNLSYACSDNKLHPEQNRVLSLYEACLLHTISDYDYRWTRADGKPISDKLIRELIGESIPPKGFEIILKFLLQHTVPTNERPSLPKESQQPSEQMCLF